MNWHRLEPALRVVRCAFSPSTEQVLAFERTPPGNPAQRSCACSIFGRRRSTSFLRSGSLALIESRATGARVEGRYFTLAPLSMLFARRVRARP